MMARSVVFVLLLASLLFVVSIEKKMGRPSGVPLIPSDSVVEKKIKLPSIGLPALPSTDPVLPLIDRADNERRSDPVIETKIEGAPVSLPLPFIVYYAYNEYHTYQKPIDVIAESIADLPVGSCREEVKRASDVYGLSYPVMMAFAIIESSCQPTQKTGSYIGLFQLSQYEFRRYGRSGGDIYNMRDNAMATAHKFIIEAINFEHAVGRYPTPFDRYCIHQQGSEGCIQHQARPDRVAWESMCATQEGRTKGEKWCRLAIWGNVPRNLKASIKGGVAALTSGEFLDIWRGRVVHFTKIMTGIREAHAETAAVTAAVPDKPRVVEAPPAKKTKVAEKSRSKKMKVAEKRRSKKAHVAEKAPAKKAQSKKTSQSKLRPSGSTRQASPGSQRKI
jgi:hypothetical protein